MNRSNYISSTHHCVICENSDHTLKRGIFCQLTDAKADFKHKCDKLRFGKVLFQRIETICLEHHWNDHRKTLVYLNLFFFISVAIVCFIGAIYWWSILDEKGLASLWPFLLVIIGGGFLPFAFSPLRKHNFVKKQSWNKMAEVKSILKRYGHDFKYDMELVEGFNNMVKVDFSLQLYEHGLLKEEYERSFSHQTKQKRSVNSIPGLSNEENTRRTWHGGDSGSDFI